MGIKNWFKRKEDNVIDLRNLQERGLLEKKTPVESSDSDSTVDLTAPSPPNPASALGFLGNLASSANNDSTVSSETGALGESSGNSVGFASERRTKLRGILRDMKGKIDTSSDKIYKLSDRIDLLERKLERLERRAGV